MISSSISRDRHISTKPAELEAFRDYGVRGFWIAGKKDLGNWENLRRLVSMWDLIETRISENGSGPWFWAINMTNLCEILLRPPPRKPPRRTGPTSTAQSGRPQQLELRLGDTRTTRGHNESDRA